MKTTTRATMHGTGWRRAGLAALALLASVCAPRETPPRQRTSWLTLDRDEGVAVARVGGFSLSAERLAQRIERQGDAAVQRYHDRAALLAFVEDQVRYELLVQAALQRGFDRDPEVIDAARQHMVQRLLQTDLGPTAFVDTLSDTAVQTYYETHLDAYMRPPEVHLAHIMLPPTAEGQALATALIAQLRDIAGDATKNAFASQAAAYSLDTTSQNHGGDLGILPLTEIERLYGVSFARMVMAMKPGEIGAAPLQSRGGWHVVRVLAHNGGVPRALDEVRETIEERLLQQARSEAFKNYLDRVRQRHPAVIYDDLLDEVWRALDARPAPEERDDMRDER